ncbi:MAG: 2OG-Fe(II) oxygenase [Gammaproteobacteria bacterium]|nr:2OG-Fe(II) oxygenase [Gammaproteobacteria bacterium]
MDMSMGMEMGPVRYRDGGAGSSGRYHRLHTRHGVSRLHAGARYSPGVMFHDAA